MKSSLQILLAIVITLLVGGATYIYMNTQLDIVAQNTTHYSSATSTSVGTTTNTSVFVNQQVYRNEKHGITFSYPETVLWNGTPMKIKLSVIESDQYLHIGFCNEISCFMDGPPYIEVQYVTKGMESLIYKSVDTGEAYCTRIDDDGYRVPSVMTGEKAFITMSATGSEIIFGNGRCKVYQFTRGNKHVFFVFGYGGFGDMDNFAKMIASTFMFID